MRSSSFAERQICMQELMSETIDDTAARNDTLEEQVEMSDEVAAVK